MINSIDYKNDVKRTDFEIVDLHLFFNTRPHGLLQRDVRLNFWAFLFVTGGTGFHSIDFDRHSYKKGDGVFILRNQVHHFEVNDQTEGYIVHINEPFLYRIAGFDGDVFLEFADSAFGSPVIPFDLSERSTNRVLLDLLYKEYSTVDDRFNIELIASLFQALVFSLRAESPRNEGVFRSGDYEHFKTFRRLVEENFAETRSVDDYAGMMNLTTKTVNKAVRKVTGLSAKQFIINRLVLEIKRYLSQGDLLNYEIADTLGFDEASNMTSFFSRYEGISPKEFRNSLGD